MRKRNLKIKKISPGISVISRSKIVSDLKSLQRLLSDSSQIATELEAVVNQLRQSGDTTLPVSHRLKDNEKYIKTILDKCSDLVVREIRIANDPKYSAIIVYIDGLVKLDLIEESVIKKLTGKPAEGTYHSESQDYAQYLLGIRPEDMYKDMNKVMDIVLNGNLVLFIDGVNTALAIDFKNPPARSVEEPPTEVTLRGPREGFTESIKTNISLIRKKIKNTNLKMESYVFGKRTKTNIVVCYLADIASNRIVNEVKERLAKIDIDSVLDSNYIGEYIEDSPLFFFPTIFRTEKPDVVAGKLLEGRIAIIVDGSPAVLTVPCLFIEFLEISEDYYLKIIPATINRWLRFVSFFVTIILPGLYVSLLTFHQELIPNAFVPTIIKARAGVPFPAMWACLGMLVVYEVLREAGVRMPRMIGPAISIVGALVLGQAAVEAGLVSTPTVIIVGFSAIASLTISSPELNTSLVFPRFIFLFLGGTLGLVGLTSGMLIFIMSMISQRSFGVPYMGPLAPLIINDLRDVAVRAPIKNMFKRPKLITWKHSIRRNSHKG
ncbi:spore germination protein [Lucifera butyrica]|nr:spore germination protein [Lucifera butyrica]